MNDLIYTIENIHDGLPIAGAANFEGHPHYFECEFDADADEFIDYRLTPLTAATLRLVLEKWQIWLRWEAAMRAGQTPLETHPALPTERLRYDELQEAIARAIREARNDSLLARAQFLSDDKVEWSKVTSLRSQESEP